jgi:hypothetical protein
VLGLFGYSILTQAWTFTVLIVVLTIVYWKIHRNEPDQKHIRLWDSGFGIDTTFTPWENCQGYWLVHDRDFSELHLEDTKGKTVKIQTGALTEPEIHEIMQRFTKELSDRREPLLDTIIRICKL